jgi:hypothetical protein
MSARESWTRLTGMIAAPRATLAAVVSRPRWLDIGLLIIFIAVVCDTTFLATDIGRLAALDQQVRQLESVGVDVDDELYAELLSLQPYQPLIEAASIVIGWPLAWFAVALVIQRTFKRGGRVDVPFVAVLAVVVHASSVFAVRAIVAWPANYVRESMGGATTLGALFPMFGESSLAARLLGAVDLFAIWAILLLSIGLSVLYERRAGSFARWLFGGYAAAAGLLAVAQAIRGV